MTTSSAEEIFTFIAYDKDQDLGKAYNKMMKLVKEDDWVVFLDHDAMFVHRDWYKYLQTVIQHNPEFQFFTATTNRIGCPWQVVHGVDKNNHDMFYHKQIAKELMDRDLGVIDVTNQHVPLSGVVMIVQKKTWDKIGGAKSGFLGVDNDLHHKCRQNGIKVGLIPSLYTYHWYRGDGDTSHLS